MPEIIAVVVHNSNYDRLTPMGVLSGCIFEEAMSWDKEDPNAKHVQLYCDTTIALPLVAMSSPAELTLLVGIICIVGSVVLKTKK
jgi:deoxyhypusine synthase